jgi:hypothetical protein
MALTQLQSDILRCLAKNRSETSYLAGGLMLNKNWQRRSDHIDIFHDTDEEVTESANKDIRHAWRRGIPDAHGLYYLRLCRRDDLRRKV